MTDEELCEALDGLFAYDTGSIDSGIHNEALRSQCQYALYDRRAAAGWRVWLATLVREMWLSDDALARGYSVEDAVEFVKWLEDRMDCQAFDVMELRR